MKKIKMVFAMRRQFSVNLLMLLSITLLSFGFNDAQAQRKWSFEARPGINFATTKLGDFDLQTGYGAEGTFAYRFMPNLGLYAGWSWNRFPAKESLAGSKMDFEETGYCFGLQFVHPIQQSKLSYMIRGGGTYNHIETENKEGTIVNDTGHGFGWQIGVGSVIPFGNRFHLVPEIRYRSLTRDIEGHAGTTNGNLNYISAGVGLSFTL